MYIGIQSIIESLDDLSPSMTVSLAGALQILIIAGVVKFVTKDLSE